MTLARLSIVLIFLGAVFWLLGALFKIQHWHMAGLLFLLASLFGCIGLILLLIKVLTYPGFKDFLDR